MGRIPVLRQNVRPYHSLDSSSIIGVRCPFSLLDPSVTLEVEHSLSQVYVHCLMKPEKRSVVGTSRVLLEGAPWKENYSRVKKEQNQAQVPQNTVDFHNTPPPK